MILLLPKFKLERTNELETAEQEFNTLGLKELYFTVGLSLLIAR